MYKTDIFESLRRISISSGGPVAGLLDVIDGSMQQINAAMSEVASGGDTAVRSGMPNFRQAIRPIESRVNEISPWATVVELDKLGKTFDDVMRDFPPMEALLRPGRQAVAQLSGAFDVLLQQNKRPAAIVGLIQPAIELRETLADYHGLLELLGASEAPATGDSVSQVEVDRLESLGAFAAFIELVHAVTSAAESAIGSGHGDAIRILKIESGSPIRISLVGNSRALRYALGILRDVLRVIYLSGTPHGRTIQSMETLARARSLGIDSEKVLSNLEAALVEASREYAESMRAHSIEVKIDGIGVDAEQPHQLKIAPAVPKSLSGPAAADEKDEYPPPKDS